MVLSNVQLEDSGVYRVETARRSGKTTSQVVLFLPGIHSRISNGGGGGGGGSSNSNHNVQWKQKHQE